MTNTVTQMLARNSITSRPQIGSRRRSGLGHGVSSASSTRRVGTISSSLGGYKVKTREMGFSCSIARIPDPPALRQSLSVRGDGIERLLGTAAVVFHHIAGDVAWHSHRLAEEEHGPAPRTRHGKAVPSRH